MSRQSAFSFAGTNSDQPDYVLESAVSGSGAVIGVDEAGRGPWAGPVTAAAFWIHPASKDSLPAGLTDSKKLSAGRRAQIQTSLCDVHSQHLWAVRHSSVDQIDTLGILPATFAAMAEAVAALAELLLTRHNLPVAMVLVDGNLLPPLDFPCQAVVRGDSRSLSIAAASVLAKQTRDEVMTQLSAHYPDYGWQTNAGYGTKAHQQALQKCGITPHHRKSFAPIKAQL